MVLDQARCRTRSRGCALRTTRRRRARDPRHARARGAADRRDRGVRRRARDAPDASDAGLARACAVLAATRPTAVNLRWALDRDARRARAARTVGAPRPRSPRPRGSPTRTSPHCEAIGAHGAAADRRGARRGPRQRPHPLQRGLARDRRLGHRARADLQGARGRHRRPRLGRRDAAAQPGPADRVGARAARRAAHGDRRQRRRPPDAARARSTSCIVGTDRTTRNGDVCNKIGTYLKALAAHDSGVPFYVGGAVADHRLDDRRAARRSRSRSAAPTRSATSRARSRQARACGHRAPVANPAFDVTPRRLVTGLITERGVATAAEARRAVPRARR